MGNPYMEEHDNEQYACATACRSQSSGIVKIRIKLSNLCSRGSHEYGNGKRKCCNAWGKCECHCHNGLE